MVRDALARRLITPEEGYARIREPDMRGHPGAILLGEALDGIHRR